MFFAYILVESGLSRDFIYPFQPLTFLEEFFFVCLFVFISVLLDVLMPTTMWTVYFYFLILSLTLR